MNLLFWKKKSTFIQILVILPSEVKLRYMFLLFQERSLRWAKWTCALLDLGLYMVPSDHLISLPKPAVEPSVIYYFVQQNTQIVQFSFYAFHLMKSIPNLENFQILSGWECHQIKTMWARCHNTKCFWCDTTQHLKNITWFWIVSILSSRLESSFFL